MFRLVIALVLVGGILSQTAPAQQDSSEAKSGKKIRALMICGGCCHDYPTQKRSISENLTKLVGPIDWTLLEYGTARDIKVSAYLEPDWIEDFDIVIHNECYGGVDDPDFVAGIVEAHVKHKVPAIMIHCSMHSYRNASNADVWREFIGVTSRRHEKSKHPLDVVPTDAGRVHAAMSSVPSPWTTPNGELYIIEKVWPGNTVLAKVHSKETGNDEPVIWANQYKGARVFGISLGHHNETVESEQWQKIVADGWKWCLE